MLGLSNAHQISLGAPYARTSQTTQDATQLLCTREEAQDGQERLDLKVLYNAVCCLWLLGVCEIQKTC